MRDVFLYGSLGSARVLEQLFGPVRTEAATLGGYETLALKNSVFPVANPSEGGALDGVLLHDLSPAQADRLAFVLEVAGATPVQCEVETAEGRTLTAMTAVLPRAAERAAAEPGAVDWNRLTEAAIGEILSYHGRRAPEAVRAVLMMIMARAAAHVAAAHGTAADYRSKTPHEAVDVAQMETPHQGFFLTRSYELRHPRFDGRMSPPLRREVFVATDASIVLPYDPRRDRVLLVEQFRMGPFGRGDAYPWMLEPVAGRVDAGETPETTAHRECQEEAGLALYGLEKVSAHYCSPGDSTEYFHVFIGLCDLPEVSQGRGGLETEHEDIRTHILSYEQAMGLLDSGEAEAGPLVLALLWLAKSRDRLRATA